MKKKYRQLLKLWTLQKLTKKKCEKKPRRNKIVNEKCMNGFTDKEKLFKL